MTKQLREPKAHLTIRISPKVLRNLDAFIATWNTNLEVDPLNRSSAIQVLITEALGRKLVVAPPPEIPDDYSRIYPIATHKE